MTLNNGLIAIMPNYTIVSDYEFDAVVNKYRAEIEYKGAKYVMHFYNNFWA